MKKSLLINIVCILTVLVLSVSMMAVPTIAVDLPKPVDTEATTEIISNDLVEVQDETVTCDEQVELVVAAKTGSGSDYELPFVPREKEHVWDEGVVTTPPTCTESGIKTYTCQINISHTYTEVIPPTGHTRSQAVIENLVNATCVSQGSYDEVVYCSTCGEEIFRSNKVLPVLESAHDWGEWVQTVAPTETEPGEQIRYCNNDPAHFQTMILPPTGSASTELSFSDDEVSIVLPAGAIPEGASFDVQKIASAPEETTQKVHHKYSNKATAMAHYEVRLFDNNGSAIYHLDSEITIKTKMPSQYAGLASIKVVQENEEGNLIQLPSWWEGEYLCYNTDWLECYD